MINLFKAELYKLRKLKAFKICILISFICAVCLAVITHGLATGDIGMDSSNTNGLSDIFIISVLGPLMTGFVICADFDSKNIHDEISCGRFSIVMSKSLIFAIVISFLALPYAIVALVCFISGAEFSSPFVYSTYLNMMVNENSMAVDASGIVKAVAILLVSFVLYVARLSFCLPLAFVNRKSVVVTVIGVISGFLIDLVMNGISKIPGIGKVTEYLPYHYAEIDLDSSASDLVRILIVSLVFIALMVILTYRLFKRSEIK